MKNVQTENHKAENVGKWSQSLGDGEGWNHADRSQSGLDEHKHLMRKETREAEAI